MRQHATIERTDVSRLTEESRRIAAGAEVVDLPEIIGVLETARVIAFARLTASQSGMALEANDRAASLIDAAALAVRTGIPATWWRDAARRGLVPHVRAGSYVRFSYEAVTAALANQPVMRRQRRSSHRIARPAKPEKAKSRKGVLPDCYRANVGDDGE